MKTFSIIVLVTIATFLAQSTYAMPGGPGGGGGGAGIPCIVSGSATNLGTVAAGDDCSSATALGALDAPCNCDGGVITPTTVSGSTVGATAENPYSAMINCGGGNADMASPAADVWYTFDVSGNSLNLDITSTLNDVSVGIYADNGGGCGNLTPLGCAVDNSGSLSTVFENINPGQTIYLQISGADDTDFGDFTVTLSNDISCESCILENQLTVNPAPINGTYQPGQTVNFCYSITDFSQENTNWLHGVVPNFGAGWDLGSLVVTPPGTCEGTEAGAWGWFTNIPTPNDGNVTGFFFDGDQITGPPDGDPTNNYGDDCGAGSPNGNNNVSGWDFCWSIEPLDCIQGGDLNVNVANYADGETGSWINLACEADFNYDFAAIITCCPLPDTSSVAVSCFGYCDGSATADGFGLLNDGTGPWDYTWEDANGTTIASQNNVNGPNTQTGLCAGTYTVTVQDANNCVTIIDITVGTPPGMTITASGVDSDCQTPCNGTTTAAVVGGSGGISYSWTTLGAGQNQTGVCAGTYTVTAEDGSGCTVNTDVTISDNPPPVITASDITICETQSGTLTVSGATTYAWSPATGLSSTSGSSVTANPTSTTTYTVIGFDANGCESLPITVDVNVNPVPIANFTVSGDFCLTNNLLDFDNASPNNGDTYSWTFPGATPATSAAQNPAAVTWSNDGVYNVTFTVTNNGCVGTITLPITINPIPVVTATGTDALCFGDLGSIIASTASAGPSYSWDGGVGAGAGPHAVGAGTYTVTMLDGNGCEATASAIVAIPTEVVMTSAATNALCFGICNGTLTGDNATGGTPGYTYSWDGGPSSGSQSQTNVCAGVYTVTATDANGCVATSTETITVPAQLTVTAAAVDASCNGVCDGDVTSVGAGGTAPITYSWDGGLGAGQDQIGTVCAGTYTVTATDANGCTATASATVLEPTLLTIAASGTNASCNGVCDGTTSSVTAGGTAPYTYSWTGGAGTNATASALCAGTYTVTVTDAEGCTATDSYTVTEPTLLTVAVNGNDASCFGVCDGDATAVGAGGTGVLTYQWDAAGGLGTAAATTSTLCAGTAGVTVTDANGCTATESVVIAEPTLLTVVTAAADASCNGVCDGDVTSVGAGGTAPLTYSWSVLGAGQDQLGSVCAGTYTLTVTDANGCTATADATVAEPTLLTVTAAAVDASCNGVCDGDVTSVGAGGTAPITYSWDGGLGAGQDQIGTVCAGTYTVTATDANGCTATASATVLEPTLLTIAASGTNASCNGVCDGTTSSVTAGGTAPYTYSWTGGAGTNATASALCAGTYTVTVTDAEGCTATDSYTVTEPTLLTVAVNGNDASCFGVCDGDATAVGAGGTGVLTYQWDAAGGLGTAAATTSTLCAGTAGVTVTDANGCTATESVVIAEPTLLTVATAAADASCNGVCDGDVTSVGAGGTAPLYLLLERTWCWPRPIRNCMCWDLHCNCDGCKRMY